MMPVLKTKRLIIKSGIIEDYIKVHEFDFNYLHPDYWGCGYMKEALIKCIEFIFDIGFENIIYSYDSKNIKSKKLCEKIGFDFLEKYNDGNFNGGISIIYKCGMYKEKFNKLYIN